MLVAMEQQQQPGHAFPEARGGAVVESANGRWLVPAPPLAA